MHISDETAVNSIMIIILIAIIVLLFFIGQIIDGTKWNNGVCPCGGHYVYEQSVGHRYTSSHIYKCDKCGKVIELDSIKNQEAKDNE